jgi:glucan 1,6-alpha-glucosidase
MNQATELSGDTDYWWRNRVIYQIYPRSFQDSNDDGVGDIPGIISRLDYLAALGIGAIWLSPIYESPNKDNGYDISDYEAILSEFGTMQDFDQLIQAARARDIRIIMDLVVNHTSDRHPWFIEARSALDSKLRDYYIWRDPQSDGGPPNQMTSTFSGSAWKLDQLTGQYYLHIFSEFQPDLNWANPELRARIYQMMNFWIEKGIGGFRMDVIDLIGKVPDLEITDHGPELHTYLKEMNRNTFGKSGSDLLTVGETWSARPEDAQLYSDPQRHELSMIFQFEHIGLDEQPGQTKWDLRDLEVSELKTVINKWQTELGDKGWNSLFWNNHDTPRIVSRWANDQQFRVISAKMLAIFLHFQKGTPYIYQGEEIGMTNMKVDSIDQINDIESINMYNERIDLGYADHDILASINAKGRDNARTPMQWDSLLNAGFSKVKPWLPVNPNHTLVNVENELADPNSIWHTYQSLIQLRKTNPIMVWGDFKMIPNTDDSVIAYTRNYQDQVWLVVINFREKPIQFDMSDFLIGETIIHNYEGPVVPADSIMLKPYEAFVVEVFDTSAE